MPIDRRALLQALAGLGGSADFPASAQDQATRAASSELLIKEW